MLPLRGRAVLAVALAVAGAAASPAAAQHVLRNDMTGGACEIQGLGVWSPTRRTCTFVVDVQGTLTVADDGLTLDGAGHTVRPRPNDTIGILVDGRTGVTVTGFVVRGFDFGIRVVGGGGNEIRANVIAEGRFNAGGPASGIELRGTHGNRVRENKVVDGGSDGICLFGSKRNEVSGNTASRNTSADIMLMDADDNVVAKNTVSGPAAVASDGIALFTSAGNQIAGNTVRDHSTDGIYLTSSHRNTVIFNLVSKSGATGILITNSQDNHVLCNDWTSNGVGVALGPGTAATVTWLNNFYAGDTAQDGVGGAANAFHRPLPQGGNHWTAHAPACVDANLDGFCDAPYVFLGNQDALPHKDPVPWRQDPTICLDMAMAQTRLPPPEEKMLADEEAVLLYRAFQLAAAGHTARLAARLAPDALLVDAATVVKGREKVLAAIPALARCPDRPARVRFADGGGEKGHVFLRFIMEGCPAAASHFLVVARRMPEGRPGLQVVQTVRVPAAE